MRRQINYDKNKQEAETIKRFLKSHHVLNTWAGSAYENAKDIRSVIQRSKLTAHDVGDFETIKRLFYAIRECNEQIAQINDDYMPQPIYEYYTTLKGLLSLCEAETGAFINAPSPDIRNQIKSVMMPYLDRIEENIQKLNVYSDEQRQRLKKVKN